MARGDYRIFDSGGAGVTRSIKWLSNDRTSSGMTRATRAGEPVKLVSAGNQFVVPLLNGDPETGTDYFAGVAASDSTETVTVDGIITVYVVVPGLTVMAAKATTTTNVDTQSEIDALLGDTVAGDVSALVYTIDEDEGIDDNIHGYVIIGGSPDTKELYFTIKPLASFLGSNN